MTSLARILKRAFDQNSFETREVVNATFKRPLGTERGIIEIQGCNEESVIANRITDFRKEETVSVAISPGGPTVLPAPAARPGGAFFVDVERPSSAFSAGDSWISWVFEDFASIASGRSVTGALQEEIGSLDFDDQAFVGVCLPEISGAPTTTRISTDGTTLTVADYELESKVFYTVASGRAMSAPQWAPNAGLRWIEWDVTENLVTNVRLMSSFDLTLQNVVELSTTTLTSVSTDGEWTDESAGSDMTPNRVAVLLQRTGEALQIFRVSFPILGGAAQSSSVSESLFDSPDLLPGWPVPGGSIRIRNDELSFWDGVIDSGYFPWNASLPDYTDVFVSGNTIYVGSTAQGWGITLPANNRPAAPSDPLPDLTETYVFSVCPVF